MTDYISREAVIELGYWHGDRPTIDNPFPDGVDAVDTVDIENLPAADVLPRDEAIKMGAELAAMHGSDATSQQLEEAYLKGVEYGMTRRDVRPVKRGKWIDDWETGCSECSVCHDTFLWEDFKGVGNWNFCPNCGADMRPEPPKEE